MVNQFDIPNVLRFEDAPGGLVRAAISTPEVEAELYLHGAHLTRWTPRGKRPVLFLSTKSLYTPGKAIRGGVPIIFPWFGDRSDGKPGPAHGFARTSEWSVEETKLLNNGRVQITLQLGPNETARGLGYDSFLVRSRITIGSSLEMELETRNEASEPFTYEEAMHSYFAVGDVHQASVSGLEGTTFIDKTDAFKRKVLGNQPLQIAKETDEVHLNTQATCVIHDPVWQRRIIIEKSGSDSTVVWNPWIDKTKGMSDMDPDGWQGMLCIETSNAADNAVHLPPGASHKMTASIRVE
jgi:glucose-6-phosphate 1-epimerase